MSLLRQAKPVTQRVSSRLIMVVAGPPGTGKSTLCGQAIPKGKTLIIALLPRELDSWLYRKYNPDSVLIEDNWKPSEGIYEATGFDQFISLCEELLTDDTYETIIVDPGTELGQLAWHKALRSQAADDVGGLPESSRWIAYDVLDDYMDQAIRSVTALAFEGVAKKPKNVLITWHVQPAKDDTVEKLDKDTKRVKLSADHLAEGTEYEGKVLPMVRGRFRRRLQALISTFVYTDIQWERKQVGLRLEMVPKYVIQVRPDQERHTKIPGKLPESLYIPNDWNELTKLLNS